MTKWHNQLTDNAKEHIDLSSNELRSLIKHAAQGAHYPMPEEMSFACVWLAQYKLDNGLLLCQLLNYQTQGKIKWDMDADNIWQEHTRPICPILLGCYLLDTQFKLTEKIHALPKTISTLLILPYLVELASVQKVCYQVEISGMRVQTNGQSVYAAFLPAITSQETNTDIVNNKSAHQAQIKYIDSISLPASKNIMPSNRLNIPIQILEKIKAYASKIYAPATEDSRLRGAG